MVLNSLFSPHPHYISFQRFTSPGILHPCTSSTSCLHTLPPILYHKGIVKAKRRVMGLRDIESTLPPGFRFYPSDEELVCYYLQKKVANERISPGTMVEVDLHAREPWELPEVAKLSVDEWYFFSFRDRKYTTGSRTNRATKSGYWKATGKDRMVHEPATRAVVGMRKTLVFYRGRAPNGQKTSWVMHEFRLETPNSPPKEDWVLCRVFHKRKGEAEQGSNHGATTATATATATATGPSSPMALLGSSPDPTVVDKFDHHQIMSSSVFMSHRTDPSKQLMHHEGMMSSSTTTLLNLAMLQYEFLELPHGMAGGDEAMMELEQAMGYGEHVGFEEHGMGEIEMESYKDGLYF